MSVEEEGLRQCIGKLANCLKQHEHLLQGSEIQTRYTLIDPLLRALGWDTEDPMLVRLYGPELGESELFRPYVLLYENEVYLAVKTEALNSDLTQSRAQCHNLRNLATYAIVTDGRHWEVYATHVLVIPGKDLVLEFDILSSPCEIAHQINYLQRSVICPCAPLYEVVPLSDAVEAHKLGTAEPRLLDPLYLPEGTKGPLTKWKRVPVESWKDCCVKVVEHLVSLGKLGPSDCPIQRPLKTRKRHRYLVNSRPNHSDGSPFDNPTQVGQIWVDTKWDMVDSVENTLIILRHVGEDPRLYGCNIQLQEYPRSRKRRRDQP
jgi:hypothetical protein